MTGGHSGQERLAESRGEMGVGGGLGWGIERPTFSYCLHQYFWGHKSCQNHSAGLEDSAPIFNGLCSMTGPSWRTLLDSDHFFFLFDSVRTMGFSGKTKCSHRVKDSQKEEVYAQ